MAFINEYVSEEDIEKYQLKKILSDLWGRGHPYEIPSYYKFSWTVDKERNIFYIPYYIGREEDAGRHASIFWWNGELLIVVLYLEDGAYSYEEKTGSSIWSLIKIDKLDDFSVPESEIISVLKEAMLAHGYRGVSSPMKNFDVSFTF